MHAERGHLVLAREEEGGPPVPHQGELFALPDSEASQRLMAAIDGLNGRYGRDVLTIGTAGRRRAWKLRSEQLSSRFTTDWDDLLRV